MNSMSRYYLLLNFWFLLSVVPGKNSDKTFRTKDKNWAYLEKFCFVSEMGKLQFSIQYPQSYAIQNLYMYFDTEDQWYKAYNNSLSCREKEAIADPSNAQTIVLSPHYSSVGVKCTEYERENETWYRCYGSRSYLSSHPRWWYFAIGNCETQKGLYVEYDFTMTNGDSYNRWYHHFSCDEFYFLPITKICMIAELIILGIALLFTYLLKTRNMLYATYKTFLIAITFEFVCLLCNWLHYDKYADNGVGYLPLLISGLFFRQVATFIFVFMLFLIAKGCTITRDCISSNEGLKFVVFLAIFMILLFGTVVCRVATFDQVETTYISKSLLIDLTLGLRVVAWLWFLKDAVTTVKLHPIKLKFYLVLCISMSFWFLVGPITQLFGNFFLDSWIKSRVVYGMDSAIMVYGFAAFLVLVCPVLSNGLFPYDAKEIQPPGHNYLQNIREAQETTIDLTESKKTVLELQ